MMDRRSFLTTTGYLALAFAMPTATANPLSKIPRSVIKQPNVDSWLIIKDDGSVEVLTGRVELGQGIVTALAQIVADELDVNLNRVAMRPVQTGLSADEGYTYGSISLQFGGAALRSASAQAKRTLL